ncbi:MAG: peptidyl-prolyl cis-trans isomerase [Ilumatobacteraceae bacterium]|nr:peptidyl-prolyl cis-trans isomerase [Ilumatobacteraceae bacterium]
MRRLLPAIAATLVLLTSCGSGSKSSSSTTGGSTGASTAGTGARTASTVAGATKKPTVKIPATLPTKLVITDLVEGTGPAAKTGDTVTVNYIGVRSADGTEFDNSYDRGQTFPVTLGENSVIQGWEQGLIGIKAGGRRQLDIPADLAYGDSPPSGSPIKAGDALSFVIDAVSITPGIDVPTANPEDKPTVDIKPSTGATATTFTDLVVGTGEEAVSGDTAYLQIIAYRGDTAAELQSTWEAGTAAKITLDTQTVPGLVTGVTGMKVGGRREIIIPPADAFGAEGSATMGLPANTDLILVVDLVLLSQSTGG